MTYRPIYYGHRMKCLHCQTIIESKHVHDFVSCKCKGAKRICIDGGGEYCRVMFSKYSKWRVTRPGNYWYDPERDAK
jgi:hypothetical protein